MEKYATMTCNISKDTPEQRRSCEDVRACVMRGYEEPLTANIMDAVTASAKDSAGIATALALLALYFFR